MSRRSRRRSRRRRRRCRRASASANPDVTVGGSGRGVAEVEEGRAIVSGDVAEAREAKERHRLGPQRQIAARNA